MDLRRLLHQAGAVSVPPGASTQPPSSPVPDRTALLQRVAGRRVPARLPMQCEQMLGTQIHPGLYLNECTYDWPASPGQVDTGFAGPRWTGPGRLQATDLLHFDTETTGLAGGTGTRAFMIGAGHWLDDGRFRVRQLTITALRAEGPMLEVFAGWIGPDTVLVSYNGKSYDAPLLNTRYRLARQASPLPGLLHLDLLHPTRRRYRDVWPNCRLSTAEQRLLGVAREDDLPGSEAPGVWRRFLQSVATASVRSRDARDMRRVLAHNDQDIRSLAGLAGVLAAA